MATNNPEEIEIPADILEAWERKRRFETLTPVIGLSLAAFCFSSLLLITFESWGWFVFIWFVAIPVIYFTYAYRRDHHRGQDDFMMFHATGVYNKNRFLLTDQYISEATDQKDESK